jgi:hypothetical protein
MIARLRKGGPPRRPRGKRVQSANPKPESLWISDPTLYRSGWKFERHRENVFFAPVGFDNDPLALETVAPCRVQRYKEARRGSRRDTSLRGNRVRAGTRTRDRNDANRRLASVAKGKGTGGSRLTRRWRSQVENLLFKRERRPRKRRPSEKRGQHQNPPDRRSEHPANCTHRLAHVNILHHANSRALIA